MTIRLICNQHVLDIKVQGRLMDRGANKGMAGSDTTQLLETGRSISLCGIDNHTVRDLKAVTAATVTKSHKGFIILILCEYCLMPNAKSIHSPLQLEFFGCKVYDKAASVNCGRTPYFQTPDGYKIPMYYLEGLPYIQQ